MERRIWLSVDMGLGRCGPEKAGLPWRCSRTFIPQTAHAQSPFPANRGKSAGWLPERHPCIATLGVLWWGIHKAWGLPDSLRTCVGRGPLVPRQWHCSYPRTACGLPRTPETPDSTGDLGPFPKSGLSALGLMQAGPGCLGHPAPASPSAPASP